MIFSEDIALLFVLTYQSQFSRLLFLNLSHWSIFRYHVPRSWLKASNNFLVILEETGGNPLGISVKLHSASIVCAQVSQSYYPPMKKLLNASLLRQQEVSSNDMIPEMNLHCRDGNIISSITFASFGTPGGSCQSFSRGNCHAPSSQSIVSKVKLHINSFFTQVFFLLKKVDICPCKKAKAPQDLELYKAECFPNP